MTRTTFTVPKVNFTIVPYILRAVQDKLLIPTGTFQCAPTHLPNQATGPAQIHEALALGHSQEAGNTSRISPGGVVSQTWRHS